MGGKDDPFDLENFSWPRPGAKLFQADKPLSPPAFLDSGPRQWWMYAESYRFAATTLVERFHATGHDQDFLSLPVLYLYRHYAELSLKYLARESNRFLGLKPPKLNHKLMPLWSSVESALTKIWPERYGEDHAAVGQLIQQLAAVDPRSDTFRFPVDKKGAPHLPDELKRFDLVHFATEMESFAHWVGGVADALSAESDVKADMDVMYREATADSGP